MVKSVTILKFSERPKPKFSAETETVSVRFRFGFGLVILTETETADWRIFQYFESEIDFSKNRKF